MWVPYGLTHHPGVKHGNADALSRRPEYMVADTASATVQGDLDNDRGGSWSFVEPSGKSPKVRRAEVREKPGEEPKDPVRWVGTPNVTAEYSEFEPRSGHGWCRVAGTNDDPGEETPVVEDLSPAEESAEDGSVSQRTAKNPMEGPAPVTGTPNVAEEQLKDPEVGPILMSKLQGELLKINEVLDSPEEVKRLLSEGDRLEFTDGVLYRRREATGLRSNPQLIVPKSLREKFIEAAHTGMTEGHLGLRRTLDQIQRRGFWYGWRRNVTKYCRRCPQCAEYHRGKLPRKGALQSLNTPETQRKKKFAISPEARDDNSNFTDICGGVSVSIPALSMAKDHVGKYGLR